MLSGGIHDSASCYQANIPTHMLTGDESTKYHIGTNALSFPREKAEVVMPLKDGMSELLFLNSITNCCPLN